MGNVEEMDLRLGRVVASNVTGEAAYVIGWFKVDGEMKIKLSNGEELYWDEVHVRLLAQSEFKRLLVVRRNLELFTEEKKIPKKTKTLIF